MSIHLSPFVHSIVSFKKSLFENSISLTVHTKAAVVIFLVKICKHCDAEAPPYIVSAKTDNAFHTVRLKI